MIRHLVLLKFRSDAGTDTVAATVRDFCALRDAIAEVQAIESGTDVSPEGLAKGFTHAFLLSFADAAAREAYLPHPAHLAFVARMQPLLDDVLVLDWETA